MPNVKYKLNVVLSKFWKAAIIFSATTFLTLSTVPAIYATKNDNCQIQNSQTTKNNLLTCSVNIIKRNFRIFNISVSPFKHFSKVTIKCKDGYFVESFLTPETFSDLGRISDLSIFQCKINELSDNVFAKTPHLKSLVLNTHNNDWPIVSLVLSQNIFRPLNTLKILDLSFNNVWEMPAGVFCPLSNLKHLNLSHNHLQDLTQLAFSNGERNPSCQSDLTSLDISFNDADQLVSGALRSLKNLEKLFIHSNNVGKIDDDALQGLQSLTTLDFSSNRLVALPENVFMHTPSLMYIYLQNNSLSVLAPALFRGLEYLVKLDLSHNELKSELITKSSFQELIRLVVLDLSHNKLTEINPDLFRDMYSVQELKLSHNLIKTLPVSAFNPCVNLHTLDLSGNLIKDVPEKAFDGIDVLSFLALDNNEIFKVHPQAFANLKSLGDLNINGNRLKYVPQAVQHLRYLKTLDLGDNQITNLNNLPVKGLDLLYGLRLVNNSILGNISRDTFINIPSLKILNLAKNKISHIESGAFSQNKNLQAVRLDANRLRAMNALFDSLQKLEWLNVSDNHIGTFDYYFIPQSLLWLDVHKNQITELGNSDGRHDLSLKTLDASFNKLTNISSIQIPKSIELAFLNDNQITVVEQYSFLNKENLSRVDLFSNRLSKMDMQALRLIPVPPDIPLPQFYLGGNSFICDCQMEWLQRINNLKHDRYYPTVMDIDDIMCKMPFIRGDVYLPLVDVDPSEFLCQYESHCFTLCHCCEFDACDCEMTCPAGCSCYHDQSWRSNLVNCSANGLDAVPDRIPMDATEVFIDGNNFKNLSLHSFIGRKHMQNLYVNNSNVENLDNETFSGLIRLTILHLEDNLIRSLRGQEFKFLNPLRELYLHNNLLNYIHPHTFMDMSRLEVLTLHNNQLINFPIWRMVDNPYLMKISLSNNRWSCECHFVDSFEIWLVDNIKKVIDDTEVKCVSNIKEIESFIIDSNTTSCLNSSSTSTVIQPLILSNLLQPVIAITVAAFIIVVVLLILFIYRNEIKVWLFSNYGIRICHRYPDIEDQEKVFDAFVSYSSKDEMWVNQVLATQLERVEKPYKICLHYRDFPVTAYITDTMLEAVNASKRTILVLSKNFIENEWCRFQYKSAHHEVLKRKRKIIVIQLGDIPTKDLDPDLKLYLKTSSCIKSDEKYFWPKLRFYMPDIDHSNQRPVHTYSTIPERSGINKYSVNGPLPTSQRNNIRAADATYWA